MSQRELILKQYFENTMIMFRYLVDLQFKTFLIAEFWKIFLLKRKTLRTAEEKTIFLVSHQFISLKRILKISAVPYPANPFPSPQIDLA